MTVNSSFHLTFCPLASLTLFAALSSLFSSPVGSNAGGAAHQPAAGQSRTTQERRDACTISENAAASASHGTRLLQKEGLRGSSSLRGKPASWKTTLLPLAVPLPHTIKDPLATDPAASWSYHAICPCVAHTAALSSIHSHPAQSQILRAVHWKPRSFFFSFFFYLAVFRFLFLDKSSFNIIRWPCWLTNGPYFDKNDFFFFFVWKHFMGIWAFISVLKVFHCKSMVMYYCHLLFLRFFFLF